MARISFLERRGATYYARVDIPSDLVPHYGTTVRKKSLRTKDEADAKRLLWPLLQAWQAEFADVRSRREITDEDKAAAAWEHYNGALDRDEQTRQHMPTSAEIEAERAAVMERAERGEIASADPLAILDATLELQALQGAREHEAKSRRVKLDTLRKHLASGETALVAHEVDEFAERHRLLMDRASPDRVEVSRRMIRGEIEAILRTLERDQGNYTGTPRDPVVRPANGRAVQRAAPGETIAELFEAYRAENPRGISADTLNQAQRDIGTFLDVHGSTLPARMLDKRTIREWKALLLRYPVKAAESKVFAGMSLAEIVRHNKTVGKPTITPKTINRYLSNLAAFCSWLVVNGYLETNPCDGMFFAKDKRRATTPFTTDQLNKLFQSPLFVGCYGEAWRHMATPGKTLIRDHRYWLPLIMLYSGARPGEIAQLATSDVRQEHGTWIFHVTDEGEDQSVKTHGSARVVPVHSELIKLGFLRYHAGMQRAGQAKLFPAARRNSRGQMVAEFSREFGRYLERLGIKTGRGLSLYSFRHGFADALRRAGHLDGGFAHILGHESSMTGRYGALSQGTIEQRAALVESAQYPGLDLSHLLRF